ncbi:MAG TPA: sensor histidine kinase [Candidatus Binatia bacterium]|nr:sensor histidine kinase [Candidatus Binatia bacterium]
MSRLYPRLIRRFGCWSLYALCVIACLIVTSGAHAADGERAKRVLMVHSFGSSAPPFTTHSTAFETTLTQEMGKRVDLDQVSLDMARYAQPDMEDAFVEFLLKRLAKWQPDLVVPIGSPAGRFVVKFRDRLFPGTPVIYTGMDRRTVPPDAITKNATFVGDDFKLAGLVEDILQLAPDTTNIEVILGATPLERYWTIEFRRAFEPFTNRVSFNFLNDLSFDQMLRRLSKLPPRSFILLGLFLRDASGVTHNEDEALQRLHAVANAPINGLYQNQLGLGIVGGRLYQGELQGVESARIAIRVLRGEPMSSFPPMFVGTQRPRYDWRELQRWNISESRLSPDSVIEFRQPTVWERYRWYIVGALFIFALQAAMITGLLLQRTRRRRAEADLQRNREELAHVTRISTVGELTTSVAHELNQPLGAILSNAEAAEMFLMADPPAVDEVRDILADIRNDDKRASEVIRRMRNLLQKHDLTPKSIEINEAVEEVLKLISTGVSARKVAIKFERTAGLPRVWCDPVHFQQVVLNLVLNGMEAMAGLLEEKRQVVVRTGPGDNGTVKIAVADSGPGIPVDSLPKLFEHFFTTKKDGMGMGLSIARTIVEAHHGQIWAENNSGSGATFYFTVPVDETKGGVSRVE